MRELGGSGSPPDGNEPTTCIEAEPYALRVLGESMAPEFPNDCIVIVDPTGYATDGAFVVAEVDGEVLLRRLRIEPTRMTLESLEPQCESLPITVDAVKGVVTQRAGRRRHLAKRYA